MKPLPGDEVVITGLGMCTSLGDAVLACAAARAGLSMACELEDHVITCEDGSDAPLVGHPVTTAAGFRGTGKLVSLGLTALEDLFQTNDLRLQSLDRTGLYVCLRAPDALGVTAGSPDAPAARPGDGLCAKLTTAASLVLPEADCQVIREGHAGFVRAVAEASARLRTGQHHRCLVGGIDSLLETATLDSLVAAGRLKTPDKPDGLHPGEAAAFLLLERGDIAEQRGAPVLAVVAGTSLGAEPCHFRSETPCGGVGLSDVLSASLRAATPAERSATWLLSDHNGEHARASELGNALVRLARDFPELGEARLSHPAESFGDTGAASAAIAACLAARAFVRGYAPHPRALILSSSETEPRGALSLKKDLA